MTRIIVVVAVVVALALGACEAPKEPSDREAKPRVAANPLALTPEETSAAGIKLETVQPQRVGQTIALNGTIVPNQTRIARVAPRVTGQIAVVKVRQGQHVRAGQTLALLESIDVGDARAAYRQASSEATLASAALERAKTLSAEDIIPKKDYLRARADAERAQALLAAAADKLRLLGVFPAGGHLSQSDAAYPLAAPFAGTVIEKEAVQGELAQPDRPLFTVADLGTVWVEADVYEKDLAQVHVGMPARVRTAAYPDRAFDGKLIYLADTMNTETRTVKARIAVPNREHRLKPGMFAAADLVSASTVEALFVPEQAVTLVQGQDAVFVATKQGFAARPVETAPAGGGMRRIKAGLASGERIAVTGVYALKARLLKSQLGAED